MQLIDTHCHIQSCAGNADAERGTHQLWEKAGYPTASSLIDRAHEAGVTKMICVGCTRPDSELAISFAADKPACFASIGIHPHEAKDYAGSKDEQDAFADLAVAPKVVAVGECGLDYFYGHSPKEDQFTVLRFQIELALKHDLPMIFHVRQAFDDFWPIFDEYHGIRGVLHSFTDSQENLDKAVQRGLHIGVNGIATFTISVKQLDMYKSIPLSRLLLETDAPFLTPSPYRGNICEPYHTKVTAEYMSELRGISLESLAAASTDNAEQLFGI